MLSDTTGKFIGHYRVGAKLGEGGMGEVWQATDTKLGREVAVKLLPAGVASDAARLARFQREAQVLASLNHPGIAAIYGVEERALVMELVEGPTLAERIAPGGMSWEEALPIARQIAEALGYAHDRGIIHRDLKPANIKITPEGQVKLLDFGLAKALSTETTAFGTAIDATTMSLAPTQAGQILGTAAYMAPEQARGQSVDKRADIWAYGVVLYEMLSGERPFGGPTISDTLASVLTATPNLARVPAPARRLLALCLEKDPKKRLRDVGDGQIILIANEPAAAAMAIPRSQPLRNRLLAGLAAMVIVALAIGGGVEWQAHHQVIRTTELNFPLPPAQSLDIGDGPAFAISPDGTRVVYTALDKSGQNNLWVRKLDQSQAVSLHVEGTAPFFSPHGRWIGFFSGFGKLEKISFFGGAPIALATVNGARGGWWSPRGFIVYTRGLTSGLSRISADGGAPAVITRVNHSQAQVTQRWPQILPGSRAVLYTASGNNNDFSNADIEAVPLRGGRVRVLVRHAYFGRYLRNGDLVYISAGTLFAAPFDAHRLQLTGPAVPILENIQNDLTNGSAQLSVARNGTAIYGVGQSSNSETTVNLTDAQGNAVPLVATPGNYLGPDFSPHGKRLLLEKDANIYIYNLTQKVLTRLTFNHPSCIWSLWSPHGRRVACSSPQGVGWLQANGLGGFHLWNPKVLYPAAWTQDGKTLILGSNNLSLWSMPLNTTGQASAPKLFLNSRRGAIGFASLSPDGHWLAYSQNVGGGNQIFVSPFPSMDGKWQVSSVSSISPVWSRAGHTLFFVENRDSFNLYAAPYSTAGGSFNAGVPRLLFKGNFAITAPYPFYDAAPDGQHFAVLSPVSYAASVTTLPTVVLHWFQRVQNIVEK